MEHNMNLLIANERAIAYCKAIYGDDWSLETAAEEEKEIYDTFSRM